MMPKEQGRFWEGAARGSSKTAKNKSNSATLQAALGSRQRNQSGMGDMTNHLVLCDGEKDSEKDSGYSGNHSSSCMHACILGTDLHFLSQVLRVIIYNVINHTCCNINYCFFWIFSLLFNTTLVRMLLDKTPLSNFDVLVRAMRFKSILILAACPHWSGETLEIERSNAAPKNPLWVFGSWVVVNMAPDIEGEKCLGENGDIRDWICRMNEFLKA